VLEHVVGEDRSYAPAWEALGQRYYFDSEYGGGGEEMFQRSSAAYERALSLDPQPGDGGQQFDRQPGRARRNWRAYDAATDLVRRRPQSADAHFALSYVLRYAGMQEKSSAGMQCGTVARSGEL